MGVTVRQKNKGKGKPWYVFVHQNKTTRSKSIGDKKLANAVAAKIRKKLVAGQLKLDGKRDNCPEFTVYAKHYIENYAKTACKRNTWTGYETIIRLHVAPAWKGKKLNQIKRADLENLQEKRKRGRAHGRVSV